MIRTISTTHVSGPRACLLIALSFALLVVEGSTDLLEWPRGYLSYVVLPLHSAVAVPYNLVGGIRDHLLATSNLRAENRELKTRLLKLDTEARQLRTELSEADARLQLFNSSVARLPGYQVARLVGVVAGPQRHEVVVDVGMRDGTQQGAPVVDEFGVFGRVIDVHQATSNVMVVTDSRFGAPAVVERTGIRGIVAGTGRQRLVLDNVLDASYVEVGDRVVTSGMYRVFPDGLLLGVVDSEPETRTDGELEILVRPAAATGTSKYLLVISVAD